MKPAHLPDTDRATISLLYDVATEYLYHRYAGLFHVPRVCQLSSSIRRRNGLRAQGEQWFTLDEFSDDTGSSAASFLSILSDVLQSFVIVRVQIIYYSKISRLLCSTNENIDSAFRYEGVQYRFGYGMLCNHLFSLYKALVPGSFYNEIYLYPRQRPKHSKQPRAERQG